MFIRNISIGVVEVLGHPSLRADGDSLVRLPVAGIYHGSGRHFGRLSDLARR